MDRLLERTKSINLRMNCFKYLLFLINILFLIIAFSMISGAATLKATFGDSWNGYWYPNAFRSLPGLWIATGCFLFALSIFGIILAIKESTFLANIYTFFLCLIFILQIAAAIMAFTLITKSDSIVEEALHTLMFKSQWELVSKIDWIQTTFQCCGNRGGPPDWKNFEKFYTEYQYWPDSHLPTTTQNPLLFRIPKSCCTADSGYDASNFTCDKYFTYGCHGPLVAVVSESVMMIGSSALAIGVVQILGIACAFMFARSIRRSKSNRDIARWAVEENMDFDKLPHIDQLATVETRPDEIKHLW